MQGYDGSREENTIYTTAEELAYAEEERREDSKICWALVCVVMILGSIKVLF